MTNKINKEVIIVSLIDYVDNSKVFLGFGENYVLRTLQKFAEHEASEGHSNYYVALVNSAMGFIKSKDQLHDFKTGNGDFDNFANAAINLSGSHLSVDQFKQIFSSTFDLSEEKIQSFSKLQSVAEQENKIVIMLASTNEVHVNHVLEQLIKEQININLYDGDINSSAINLITSYQDLFKTTKYPAMAQKLIELENLDQNDIQITSLYEEKLPESSITLENANFHGASFQEFTDECEVVGDLNISENE